MRDIDLKALVDTFDAAAQALGAEENIHAMRAGLVVSFHKLTKEELLDRLESAESRAEEAEKECAEQARLLGMGAERELALMAKLEESERDLRAENLRGDTYFAERNSARDAAVRNRKRAEEAEKALTGKPSRDWQGRCLERGFEYVREPDDHYVLADVPEMAGLLSELLGVEVRSKENESYGQTVRELRDELDAASGAYMRAYEAEKERDALLKDAESWRRWIRWCERDDAELAKEFGK